jgi:hypothetical protein
MLKSGAFASLFLFKLHLFGLSLEFGDKSLILLGIYQ